MVYLYNLCNPCCTRPPGIGFDLEPISVVNCYDSGVLLTDLAGDGIDKIDLADVIFAGQTNGCGEPTVNWDFKYDIVREWIEKGGRLVQVGENLNCTTSDAKLNAFIAEMGGTMTLIPAELDPDIGTDGCPHFPEGVPGAAKIAEGLDELWWGGASKIEGGTSVIETLDGDVIMAVEKIGKGFLFLCGDSDLWTSDCPFNNCELARRLLEFKSADIIGEPDEPPIQ